MKKYIIAFMISLVWLVCENPIREILLEKDSQALFVTDTKPIALYSFIGMLCIFVLNIICDIELNAQKFALLCVCCFVLPLTFFQVRTEVYQNKIVFYDAIGQEEEYSIKDINFAFCKLDYQGREDIPFSGVRFVYEIHFYDKKLTLYGSYNKEFWKNIELLDKQINESNIEKSFSGIEYIKTIKQFNKIDQWSNYLLGVYSNINKIEDIMTQKQSDTNKTGDG